MLSSLSSNNSNSISHKPAQPGQPLVHLSAPVVAPSGVELQRLVTSPESECGLEDFASALTIRDVIFECEGDGSMAQHPGFPGAVRQVIGSELMKTASREALGGVPCAWGPACGLHVFFNGQRGSKDLDIPPPWVVRSETTGANSLRITLRLFGLGLLWSSELSEACHRAIERGISLTGVGQVCQSVLIRSVEAVWTGLQDEPANNSQALVSFQTPLRINSCESNILAGKNFFAGLAKRSANIARWHGIQLVEDRAMLEAFAEAAQIDEVGLGEIEWNRSVSQQGGANIAMKGQMGLLQIRLPAEGRRSLIRLLQIGELLHAGGKIAFGQGRYELYLIN